MRREEFNITDTKAIKEVLDQCEYGVLSLISDNKPYSVPLNFVYHNEKLYFHGSKKGKKIDLINNNNSGTFLVVKPYAMIPSYFSNTLAACPATQFFASVFFEGEIKLIHSGKEKSQVLNALMEKLQKEGGYEPIDYEKPMYTKMIENTGVLEFTPTLITCKIKVGQNLTVKKKENLIDKLSQRDTDLDKETLDLIKKLDSN